MTITMTVFSLGVLPADIGESGILESTNFAANNPSSSSSGTISLIGPVTGSGSTAITTTISPNAITSAQIASGAVTPAAFAPGAVTSAAINNGSVTYSKIQNESANTLLGNPTGSSATPAEIGIAGGLRFSGGVILPPSGGFENLIRNGAMNIGQRGFTGTVASGTGPYTLDGWQVLPVGASLNWSQGYGRSGMAGSSLRFNAATGMTSMTLVAKIESYISVLMQTQFMTAQAVTIQFAINNNTTSAVTPTLGTLYPTAQDNWASSTTDLAAVSLQTVPALSSAIVAYTFVPSVNAANGYQIQLGFGGSLNASSGNIQVSYADLRVTPGVPTGVNNNPPIPEVRFLPSELALCQRYYAQTFPYGTVAANNLGNSGAVVVPSGTYYTGDQPCLMWRFPVTMRATPSITTYNPNNTGAGQMGDFFGQSPTQAATVNATNTNSVVITTSSIVQTAYTPAIHLTASAEL